MPFVPVDISGGQVSGVDALSSAASFVDNLEVDEAGINHLRPPLAALNVQTLSQPINGVEDFGEWLIVTYDGSDSWQAVNAYTQSVLTLNDSSTSTQLTGTGRGVFVRGSDYLYATKGDRPRRWRYVFGSANLAEELTQAPTCTHIATLGQRLIANDDSDPTTFRWSDVGEGVWDTWPAANVASTETTPDPIVALADNAELLWIWGSNSVEIYGLTPDPDFPFGLLASLRVGLAAPYAFVRMDKDFIWLDERRRIVRSEGGGSYEVLSDAIQRDLRQLSDVSDCWMYRESRSQFDLLVVRFPTAGKTYVRDMKSGAWSERSFYGDYTFRGDYPIGAACYWDVNGYFVQASSTNNGFVYYTTSDAVARNVEYEDDGDINTYISVVGQRITGWQSSGTMSRKRYGRLRVVLRRGTSSESTVSDQGALELRVQDDDGPWGEWEQIPIGSASEYESVVDVHLAGIGRRRRYHLRYSSIEPTAIAELYQEVIAELGA